jgi:RNase P subunit RPR2
MKKECLLYRRHEGGAVTCLACQRKCRIADSKTGWCGTRVNDRGILEIAVRAKESGMHVEVVTNVIPGINDSDAELSELAAWIRRDLGPGTPWHVTRYCHQCGALLVERSNFEIVENRITNGTCRLCGAAIPGRF